MAETLPVIAAVANYNMATELAELLPSVTQQGYARIFVLDDASTDHSREVVQEYGSDVTFVEGSCNKGSGANRNRILKVLGRDAIVHFLDADTRLETERTAEVVRDVVPSSAFGFVGGISKTPAGIQSVWNYGPRQSLRADIGANIQARIGALAEVQPQKAEALRHRFNDFLAEWPNPFTTPVRRSVYWNLEQNLIVRSDIFAKVGGFDEKLREHEIQDLAIRMARFGLPRFFDPLVAVRHTEAKVRDYNRLSAQLMAELYITRKHGLLNWLLSRDASRLLL